jgi:hypothetical protein
LDGVAGFWSFYIVVASVVFYNFFFFSLICRFGYDSLMKTEGGRRRLMKAILEGKKVIAH